MKTIKNILGWIVFIGAILVFAYAFLNVIIANTVLKRKGVWTKAIIYREVHGRSGYDWKYRFFLNGEEQEGVVSEDGVLKKGDTVCVIYLKNFPSFNRPCNYYNSGEISCNCR